MSRRLLIDDGRSERELLVVGTMVVGRDPECEISSNDPRLSRRHAEFRTTPGGVVVRDLGSRNGVRVNGRPITEVMLNAGDVVSLAHLSMRLVDDAPAAAAVRAPVVAPMTVTAPQDDDRTRVAPRGGRPVQTAPVGAPADVGEIVIRERAAPAAAEPATPPEALALGAILKRPWGRRVAVQGLLLAGVVFFVTAVPLLAWQARTAGGSALAVWPVLVPPFAASACIGVLVAGLIARTAVRGARRDGR